MVEGGGLDTENPQDYRRRQWLDVGLMSSLRFSQGKRRNRAIMVVHAQSSRYGRTGGLEWKSRGARGIQVTVDGQLLSLGCGLGESSTWARARSGNGESSCSCTGSS